MNAAPWLQNYDPLGNPILSTLAAAAPVVVLLLGIGVFHLKVHWSALLSLGVAWAVATGVFHMPASMAGVTTLYGGAYGLFPIGWIILNVLFLHQLTVQRGLFDILKEGLAKVAPDPRIQVILIAFSFGAFIEGVAGFGAPVAITGAILMQLGFKPLHASGLALIANTAPVAFGSLGIPLTTLSQITGMDVLKLSAMVGRQLPVFSLIIPFWVLMAFVGFRRALEVWPAALTAGLSFAIPQCLVSHYHGPYLVDLISGGCSILATSLLLKAWSPPRFESALVTARADTARLGPAAEGAPPSRFGFACMPWVALTGSILLWSVPAVKQRMDAVTPWKIAAPGLHGLVQRVPPIAALNAKPEAAEYKLNLLTATGTPILFAGILSGLLMGCSWREMGVTWLRTVWKVRYSLVTIAAMLALGNVTKFSGADGAMGLVMAKTGYLYPFFGTLLGWLGVALTGSDTASNVLFGSLQQITAEQTGLSPILMGAANSSGGVMGKMVDAQSIVVASTATGYYGQEGAILKFVFWHSLILASLVGVWVFLLARVPPFTEWVIR
ncbi:MAG: L-lactate permease [Verrucomicrobia bacterium]|nr:L-lactate permease [Verrucomicrobiota bacterium]